MKQSAFRFKNPVLTHLQYEVNDRALPKEPEQTEISIAANVSVRRLADRANSAVVSLKLELPKDNHDNFPFSLSAAMSAQFEWDEGLSDESVNFLLTRNAPALLLGYLRPWVADVTGAGPSTAVHIPFMDFSQEPSEEGELQ